VAWTCWGNWGMARETRFMNIDLGQMLISVSFRRKTLIVLFPLHRAELRRYTRLPGHSTDLLFKIGFVTDCSVDQGVRSAIVGDH